MRDSVETFKHAGKSVSIYYDTDPPNPCTDFDNLTTLACWHRRVNLGSTQIDTCSEEELRADLIESGEEVLAVLPLYLYQHGGMTISTSGFSCSWDSGQVGWAYVTKASAERMGCVGDRHAYDPETNKSTVVGTWDEEALLSAIRSDVETYDLYLTGQCYGYEVVGREGDHLDSCWGFLGGLKYVRAEARLAAEQAEDPADAREPDVMLSRMLCGACEA